MTFRSIRRATARIAGAILVASIAVAAVPIAASAAEADKPKEEKPKLNTGSAEAGTEAVTSAALAAQLALEGERRKSPLLLLAAAELLGDLRESRQRPEVERASEPAAEAPASATAPKKPIELSVPALVARARAHAGTDEKLSDIVDQFSSRGLSYQQGASKPSVDVQGRAFKVIDQGVIGAGETITLSNVIFDASDPAAIIVSGDGDGDVDLWVYDGDSGGLIGDDCDTTSQCIVTWRPLYRGPFTVKMTNVGSIAERYVVLANWDY